MSKADGIKGLKLIFDTQPDGSKKMRKWFYGQFWNPNTKKPTAVNLHVRVKGKPPASLADEGDLAFEKSRTLAEKALADYLEKLHDDNATEHILDSLVKMKAGQKYEDVKLTDLGVRYRARPRAKKPTERYLSTIDKVFADFAAFAYNKSNKTCTTLAKITPEIATAFFEEIKKKIAWSYVRRYIFALSGIFRELAPASLPNPFGSIIKVLRESGQDCDVIHRRPLSQEELEKVYATAKDTEHPFLYDIAVTASCTALRLKDCCLLKWEDVIEDKGMIRVQTAKTGIKVPIPIFGKLKDVLDERKKKRDDEKDIYVFPDAAAAYKKDNYSISKMGTALFARALFKKPDAPEDATLLNAPQLVPEEIIQAIKDSPFAEQKKARVIDSYTRYAIDQHTYREIEAETGRQRGQVSEDLKAIEKLLGVKIRPCATGKETLKDLIQHTRASRTVQQKKGSEFGWHSLRATWVVLALINGLSEATVMKIVGHKTVHITYEYFNPTDEIAVEATKEALGSLKVFQGSQPMPMLEPPPTALPAVQPKLALAKLIKTLPPKQLKALKSLPPEVKAELATMTPEQAKTYLEVICD